MIEGTVNENLEALIDVRVRRANATAQESVHPVVDTGFNGWLTIPKSLAQALSLPWRRSGYAVLADGSTIITDIFEGEVFWNGGWRRISIDTTDGDALIGMRLLANHRLAIEVKYGGKVEILPLPTDH